MASLLERLKREQEGKDDAPTSGSLKGRLGVLDEPAIDSPTELQPAHKPYVPLAKAHKSAYDRVKEKNILPNRQTAVAPMDDQLASIFRRTYQSIAQGTGDIARTAALSREHIDKPDYMIDRNLDWAHMTPVEQAQVAKQFQGKSEEEIRNIRMKNYTDQRDKFISEANRFAEWMPEVEAKKTTGALGILDDVMSGMSRFAPTMVAGALTGGAASMPIAYMQLMPGKFDEYTKAGADPERAFNTAQAASISLALVESLGTNFQLKNLGKLFRKGPKGKTLAPGFSEKFFEQLYQNGKAEGIEEITQGEIEVIFDVYAKNPTATPEQMGKKIVDIWKDPAFQKGVAYEGLIGTLGGMGMGGGAVIVSEGMSHVKGRAETKADGRHIIVPEDADVKASDPGTIATEQGKPTVKTLLGVESSDVDTTAPVSPKDGVSVGSNLDVTAEQAKDQIVANEAVKSVLAKAGNEQNLKSNEVAINAGEARIQSLNGFYEDAMVDGDHEGALQVAKMIEEETNQVGEQYQDLAKNYATSLEQQKLLPDPDEFVEVQAHVERLQTRAKQQVQAQTNAVNNIRIKEQQTYIDTLGTAKGLEAELIASSVQATRDGKNQVSKIYDSVVKEMKLIEGMGQTEYMAKTPIKRLIDLKNSIGKQSFIDRQDKADANTMARNNAMESWIDEQLLAHESAKQDRLQLERAQLEARIKVPEVPKEQPQVRPEVRETLAEKQEARAKREREAPKVVADLAKAQRIQAEARTKKEQARVAEVAKKVEKGKREVQDLRAALRKPTPQPTRKEELEQAKADKAKRVQEIKKQVQRVEGLERPATPIKKGKATVKDLKKDTSNFVILTSDNPQSKQASPAANVKARAQLKKKLDDLGIDYTIGKSKFEGMPEVPFIIHNMSKAEGKKLSDELGQSSFIFAEGGDVALVEGKKSFPGKRADIKLAPDATDYYTEVGGQKFTMDFDFSVDSELDTEQMQVAEPHAVAAKKIFKAAAVQMPDGTIHQGTSHMDIVDRAIGIEAMIKMPMSEARKMKDGFVTFDGTFVERGDAAKMVGVKGDETLYSEEFLHKVMDGKHDQAQVQVAGFTKQTLKNKMGTLEVMMELDTKMKEGRYKWLFDYTRKNGIKTQFVTDQGQYVKLEPVKRTYSNLRQREAAGNRFDGAMELNPLTGEMAPTPGLKGVYLKGQKQTVINLPAIGRSAKTLDEALETVVHEHIHGMVDLSMDQMTDLEKDLFEEELQRAWDQIDQDFLSDVRNDPKSHPRVLAGTTQVDQSIKELITYSLAHPEFAAWLDTIPAGPNFRAKSSKIKTVWDSLVDLIITKILKKPSKHDEIQAILNKHLKFGQRIPGVKYSKEQAATFDFGANVTPENVRDWVEEMDAPGAATTFIVKNGEEFKEQFGFTPDPDAPAVWLDADKGRKAAVKGTTAIPAKPALPQRVVFISDRIDSQEDFVYRYMHEQAGHVGLRNLFGENSALMNRFLDQAFSIFQQKDAELLKQTIETYDIGRLVDPVKGIRKMTKTDNRVAAEEVIATKAAMLKPTTKKSLLKRFTEFLKRWLPKKFVARVSDFRMTEEDVNLVLEAARESVFTRDTRVSDKLNKALESRRPVHKFKGWEKLPAFMESDKTYMEWAKEVAKSTPEAKEWYEQHVNLMREHFGKDADLLSVLLAMTSPQADVETNVQFAIDSYLFLLGKTNKPGHRFPKKFENDVLSKWTDEKGMLDTLESNNFKVTEFLRALMGDTSATVGDIWMYRAFFGDNVVHNQQDENPRVSQQVALRQKLHDLASRLTKETGESWSPRDLQAAIWVYVNAKTTGKNFNQVASFKSGFNKPTAKYGGKTPLEHVLAIVPQVKQGPLSQQIGIEGIEQAPISTLQKKNILALSREGVSGKYVVSANGDIRILKPSMDNAAAVKLIDAIVAGGRTVTAKTKEQAEWYREVFGFEELDGLNLKLSDAALKLYTTDKGKVTVNSVRDNLGGFENVNFSPTVRYSKEARENLDKIAEMSQEDINELDSEFIRTGNDNTSVINKIHEWRDSAQLNIDRFTTQLEQEFLEKFGGRTSKILKLGSGRRLNTANTELLQKAMNLYIDSGTGKNLEKVEAYVKKLAAKGKKITGKEFQQLDIIERMLAMTPEERAWADSNIRHYYDDFFSFAKENKLIDSHIDNYVKRMWKRPDSLKDDSIVWSGGTTAGFKLVSDSGKQRTFDSIIDGWDAGMSLQAEGVIGNLQAYGSEIGYTFANRRFVNYLRSMIDFKTDGLMFEVDPKKDPDFKPGPSYLQITMPGFAKPFHKLYARKDIANTINKIGRTASRQIWEVGFVKFLRRMNASIKSTLLSVSLFHHLAGMRSYTYGVTGVHVNGIKAYKEGLRKIDEQTEFTPDNLKKLGPAVDFLVKEGLTLGKTQDWDETVMQESFLEDFMSNRTGKPSRKLLEAWQYARRKKRAFTTGLFNRLFAGLKAESAVMEFVHSVKKQEAELDRPLNDAELKLTAQKVSTLINADYGGLHLARMGRNPDLQRLAQMLLLAPDWTESNWRTVTGMVPGLNNKINKMIGDNPEVEGMEHVYRGFWGGIAVKGLISVALSQAAIMGLFADDDERAEYWDFFKDQFSSWEKFSKGRWISLDFTPIARMLGVGDPEKRQVFSIMGHFKDILKIFDIWSLIKHKISPAVKVVESGVTLTDWKDARFTSLKEAVESGSLVQANTFADDLKGLSKVSQLPSWAIYNLRGAAPIPMGEVFQVVQGESSPLASGFRVFGADVRDVRHVPAGQRKYEEINSEINELDKALKDAQLTGDRRMIVEARKDIKRYDGFNKKKSRVGFTKAQLRPINREIKRLELKAETDKGLTPRDERTLAKEKKKKAKVYDKFLQVIER
jgi:hypothetical protein